MDNCLSFEKQIKLSFDKKSTLWLKPLNIYNVFSFGYLPQGLFVNDFMLNVTEFVAKNG